MRIEKNFIFDKIKCNVLIVDNSKVINEILTKEFNNKGYITFNVSTIEKAKEIIKKEKINYLLFDINLIEIKDTNFITILNKNSIKFFALSKEKNNEKKEFFTNIGAIDFIIKDDFLVNRSKQILETIEKIEKNKNNTILIIDDSSNKQQKFKNLLEKRNYQVVLSSNLDDFSEIIDSTQPDLVLLNGNSKNYNLISFLEKNEFLINNSTFAHKT